MSGATAVDVLEGRARWSCVESDALAFLRSLPDDSVDLLFTSPPYLEARTYSRDDVSRKVDEWVPWMVDIVRAAAPKVRGLIAINCEGQTRQYRYLPGPFLLIADLYRAGFNLRKPVVFHRVGVPGGGGSKAQHGENGGSADWLRNDWEPVVCVSRPGKLPWADGTACGHRPKWAPGGACSNRLSDGTRVNQWGKTGTDTGTAVDPGGVIRSKGKRPSHRTLTAKAGAGKVVKRAGERDDESTAYLPPAIANPGNVIQQLYTADEVTALLAESSDVIHCNVGGGQMGHACAHENEAPFPLDLAAFFVKSFCPPDGVVVDCFSGSGTTCHAAFQNGRRFVGADLRLSQVELCRRRMRSVTPPLFSESA